MTKLGVKKLSVSAIIPEYQTKGASGFDLHSDERVEIEPHSSALVKTNLAFEIPEGYEVQIRSRSGLAAKNGIQAHFGTIDSDYTGNIGVILFNHWNHRFVIEKGDRIAQAIISPVTRANIVEVSEIKKTERGEGGFGSTGITSNKPL